MKKSKEKMGKKEAQNNFYKTNPRGGISLIVLVITIIVVIILAAAVIISLQNNNPMVEANKARINSDVVNMQAIFTNTVGKIMAENQDVVQVEDRQLNSVTSGQKKTTGETIYKIVGDDDTVVVEGNIIFGIGKNAGTTYYTGKELPIYSSETKWRVDKQGLLSVEVGGVPYGEGSGTNNPPVVEEGEEIAESENPMLQSWNNVSVNDFHSVKYKQSITKIKFAINVKVPSSKIESWDVSEAKDGSVMAWAESDGIDGYILTIAGKEKIIANTFSSYLFAYFSKLESIEGLELLDTSNAKHMSYMFENCKNLKNLNLNNFNTSNVSLMRSMFNGCSNLINLDLSSFDTSNVTDLFNMFGGCSRLETLELGDNFNLYKIRDTRKMFSSCNKLTTTLNINRDKNSEGTFLYDVMFENAAKINPAKITLNYTADNESVVDDIIATKSTDSNVVKGIQID